MAFVLLTGMRRSEALGVRWDHIRLDGEGGWQDGVINLPPDLVKTKRGRQVDLAVSVELKRLLGGMKLRSDEGRVFRLSTHRIDGARTRMTREFGAPERFTWQILRRTCATVLNNAPSIFEGGVAAFKSAKQLGHSVVIAESKYAGLIRIDANAETLEAAMGIEKEMNQIIREATAGRPVVVRSRP